MAHLHVPSRVGAVGRCGNAQRLRSRLVPVPAPSLVVKHSGHVAAATPSSWRQQLGGAGAEGSSVIDIRRLSDVITAQAVEDTDRQYALEQMANVLQVPLATVKSMAFKQKALLSMDAAEVQRKVEKVAEVVEVSYEKALRMAVIQPALLTDTDKQAEALKYGLRMICYDLKAPKDEIVDLIISNPSVLHGRQMHLSVADVAHLALLREPRGRIAE